MAARGIELKNLLKRRAKVVGQAALAEFGAQPRSKLTEALTPQQQREFGSETKCSAVENSRVPCVPERKQESK